MNVTGPLLLTDFDRTLVYFYRDTSLLSVLQSTVVELYARVLDIEVENLSPDGYLAWHQLHERALLELSPDASGALNAAAERLVTHFEIELARTVELLPHVDSTVEALAKRGIELGIVSSNSARAIEVALARYDLSRHVNYVGGRPLPFEPRYLKPSPYQLEQAIDVLRPEQTACWYVGDDPIDVLAGKSAGLGTIAVASGRHTASELEAVGADYVFESFADLTPEQLLDIYLLR
jgi:phosphoglycolate phosphatase-like HAD superfamily hydrolase